MLTNKNDSNYKVIKIFTVGDEYLNEVIWYIEKARFSIEIESYIFENCEASAVLFKALDKAVHRGVVVRLMVDGFGSMTSISQLMNITNEIKIQFKVYHPMYYWPRVFKWNKRNHRKIFLIDDQIAFLGSYNVSKVHFSFNNENPWQDLGILIQGDSVKEIKKSFNHLWESKRVKYKNLITPKIFKFSKKIQYLIRNKPIRINTHWYLRLFYWLDLLRRIRFAENRIYIMNAYFIPHRTFLKNLIKASQRGVEVVLVLPDKTDVPIVKWATPILYKRLLKENIKIFEYSRAILHTKSLIIDDWAIIGSHNLNHRSLIHDLECEAVVSAKDKLLDLLNFFKILRNESDEVKKENLKRLSLLAWLKYRFALLFKYFI